MGKKAFGEQNPTLGEDAVSWQTWSDGLGSIPIIVGDPDWGKLKLELSGKEGRSVVYDMGSSVSRLFRVTENRYGTGVESAVLQIRGSTTAFNQDDASPSWEDYSTTIYRTWRYVQIRETTGTFYYVTSSGNDGNSGTFSSPWQTLTAVNSASLVPGDRVYFNRGETFSGQLTPVTSGSSDKWIVYGAYGSGGRPIIDGISARALVVNLPYNYMRFESLHFYRSAGLNECAEGWSNNLYFYNCEISYSGGLGISSWSSDGTGIYNVTYDHCIAHHNGRSGIYSGSTTDPGPHDILITHCEGYANGSVGQPAHGMYVKYGTTVEYCYSHDHVNSGSIKVNQENYPATIYFPIVRYNRVYNDPVGLYVTCNGAKIYNNLVEDCGTGIGFDGSAIVPTQNCEIYFNTIVHSKTYAAVLMQDYSLNNIIKNNIFVQDTAVESDYLISASGTNSLATIAANNTFDYNIYYYNGNTASHAFYDGATSAGKDWTEWKAYTGSQDAHSVYLPAVPDFVSRYTNLKPLDGGNLKGLGIAITGYELDYYGKTRANPPTPGCHEDSTSIYYVDAINGDDSYDGLSEDTAWQTISKVNAASLVPGDVVYFNKGDTFTGRLIPPSAGAAGNIITFGAYGTGARPIIDGSASSSLYINDTSVHHLRFDGIDFNGATGTSVETVRAFSHDLYFYDCVIRNSASYMSFGAWSNTGAEIYNVIVDSCIVHDSWWTNIYIGSSTGEFGPHDCEVKGCESYNSGKRGYVAYGDHGIYVKYGVKVHDNYCHDNLQGSGIKPNCQTLPNASLYPEIYNNRCTGNYYGMYLADKALVYNNKIWANTHGGFAFDPDGNNGLYYFNTLVNNGTGGGGSQYGISMSVLCTGNILKNNLIIQDSAVAPAIIITSSNLATAAANNTFDYNVYYKAGNIGDQVGYDIASHTLAQWQSETGNPDAHSTILTTLPGLVSRYTDLHPSDGGNLKGLGVAIGGYGFDMDGNSRVDPPTPGCYEESTS